MFAGRSKEALISVIGKEGSTLHTDEIRSVACSAQHVTICRAPKTSLARSCEPVVRSAIHTKAGKRAVTERLLLSCGLPHAPKYILGAYST